MGKPATFLPSPKLVCCALDLRALTHPPRPVRRAAGQGCTGREVLRASPPSGLREQQDHWCPRHLPEHIRLFSTPKCRFSSKQVSQTTGPSRLPPSTILSSPSPGTLLVIRNCDLFTYISAPPASLPFRKLISVTEDTELNLLSVFLCLLASGRFSLHRCK